MTQTNVSLRKPTLANRYLWGVAGTEREAGWVGLGPQLQASAAGDLWVRKARQVSSSVLGAN